MSFGPESTNPRERRAYAHSMIANAQASGSAEAFKAAELAVINAGDSRKSELSRFSERLFSVLMSDEATRVIVETAYEIDLTVTTPLDRMALGSIGKSHDRIGRVSPDYKCGHKGVWMGRYGISDAETGAVEKLSLMWVADFDLTKRMDVPGTENGELIDPRAIRQMPDQARQELADSVAKVA